MERKPPFLQEITRCICFSLGALVLIALYVWRICIIIGEKQELAEKSHDELIEEYFSPSGIHGWEGIAEETGVYTGQWRDDMITTYIKVIRDGKEYRYHGDYDKDGSSDYGKEITYDGLVMEVYIEDTYDTDLEELVISSHYGEKEIKVYADFSDRKESYTIGYEDEAYASNFKMEKDIKMSGKEIVALNGESVQVLEQILYERCYNQMQDMDKMTGTTICFAVLLLVWVLIMMPFHQKKRPVEEEK